MNCNSNSFIYESERYFNNPPKGREIVDRINAVAENLGPLTIMEICGTHTMSIAKTGIKALLPANIRLVSGPGCPVCVTPTGDIDNILTLSKQKDIIIACYGDLLKVPGTSGENLMTQRARDANIEIVYSAADAVSIAQKNPDKEVAFVGIGFETTAPGTAVCILEGQKQSISNLSVLSLLKRTEPALRLLIESDDFGVNAFLCPGHVAAITGSDSFSFLAVDYGLPAVVSGFEGADLLFSIYLLADMIQAKRPALLNEYKRAVRCEGNKAALKVIERVFKPSDSLWRGLGRVDSGGYEIQDEFSRWDARKKFALPDSANTEPAGCLCAKIIRGVQSPADCPLFGKSCTPAHPIGPCMVSSEGSCAAAWNYE